MGLQYDGNLTNDHDPRSPPSLADADYGHFAEKGEGGCAATFSALDGADLIANWYNVYWGQLALVENGV